MPRTARGKHPSTAQAPRALPRMRASGVFEMTTNSF
eukprot:CAMPEP_0197879092 /NCGR_PEP_ID=MMETSP1439-20131203/7296_1 /TAXON_ID=66791 /ORGANISM="Gonyaulax spinifera, Strain CCMP409" /LENGTH=35 /DNA_ID= /DNA_START= /DNA_END= /DNA_ORIENTATION=